MMTSTPHHLRTCCTYTTVDVYECILFSLSLADQVFSQVRVLFFEVNATVSRVLLLLLVNWTTVSWLPTWWASEQEHPSLNVHTYPYVHTGHAFIVRRQMFRERWSIHTMYNVSEFWTHTVCMYGVCWWCWTLARPATKEEKANNWSNLNTRIPEKTKKNTKREEEEY